MKAEKRKTKNHWRLPETEPAELGDCPESHVTGGYENNRLVVEPTPLKHINWDDDIPNCMEKHVPNHKPEKIWKSTNLIMHLEGSNKFEQCQGVEHMIARDKFTTHNNYTHLEIQLINCIIEKRT